jgi:adenine-specific DNA-methyltransferase
MDDDTNIQKIDLDKVDWRGSREFFESLGEALDKLDDKDETYDFTWVGKRKAIIEAGAPINKTFRPNVEESKNWDTTENLFIEGDNLDALKLLQESYLGKVKMIYIDPPYNTGKDFVYHDNFKANIEQYDEDTEYKDEAGNIQFKKNEKTNGRYHSDWLNMMYPRLKLAKNLLTNDGFIFISIDDNEQANLKKLCDEIFGEDNFVGNFTVENNPKGRKNARYISVSSEYCMVYARNSSHEDSLFIESIPKGEFKVDDKGRRFTHGKRVLVGKSTNPTAKVGSEKNYVAYYDSASNDLVLRVEMIDERDNELISKGYNRYASVSNGELLENTYTRQKLIQLFEDEALIFKPDSIYEKDFNTNKRVKSIITSSEKFDVKTETAGSVIGELAKYFDFPKNTGLIKALLSLIDSRDCLVMDFFSGSATTAHAVMQINAEDGGSRKWIMVQLPEVTDEGSEAYKSGYKTIPEISRERIRRAGDKIAKEHPDAKVDYGFRSLTIAETNYKDVYKPAHTTTQQELLSTVDNVKEDRSELDLLYRVLTASALELNRPLETRNIEGSNVFLYDYFGEVSGLVACFADTISEETIKAIAALKPLTAVFRDATFPDSQAKVNLSEHFRIISPDTKVKVI